MPWCILLSMNKIEQFKQKMTVFFQNMSRFAQRAWYQPLVGLLAGLDNFIVIVPTDGLVISSGMLTPKRWPYLAFWTAFGSSAGVAVLAYLVQLKGLPWILDLFPGIDQTKTWTYTAEYFKIYGLYVVFFIAATPMLQQPAVIIAVLVNTPLYKLIPVLFCGRLIKYIIMSYIAAKAPHYLSKMWGLKSDMKAAGLKVDNKT
ncbi:MAG: hypothetical protein JNM93_14145 [Bacteriovoracaceae bacterium]|nr:hypothetical protein [Bacteriovoracaceae bacterium]